MNADIVVPTTRPERLGRLLARLRGFPGDVIVVDGTGRSPAYRFSRGLIPSVA